MNQLLDILQTNALEPREAIAKMLGMGVDEVNERIRRLESDGVIRGYQAIVNEDRIETNRRVTAVIEGKIAPERNGGFDRVADRVAQFPEVQDVYLMSGGFDLMLFVVGEDLREIAHFVSEKLSTIHGVLSCSTHFQLKTYKRNRVLMAPPAPDERLAVTP